MNSFPTPIPQACCRVVVRPLVVQVAPPAPKSLCSGRNLSENIRKTAVWGHFLEMASQGDFQEILRDCGFACVHTLFLRTYSGHLWLAFIYLA